MCFLLPAVIFAVWCYPRPRAPALLRLAACVLIEAHDEWTAGARRYLADPSMATLANTDLTALPAIGGLDTGAPMTA